MTALARLCGRSAKGNQARTRLADLPASPKASDTADLLEARRLVSRRPRAPKGRGRPPAGRLRTGRRTALFPEVRPWFSRSGARSSRPWRRRPRAC